MFSLSSVIDRTAVCFLGALALTVGAALAQGSGGRLPPAPLPGAESGRLPAAPLPVPSGSAPASAPATSETPAAPASQDLAVIAGAGEDKRRALLGRIMEAKNQGIGTSTYMMAFDALEQSVKGGETEANVLKRVSSLNGSLDDQFKRSAILKTQRAAPPIAASAPATPFGSTGGASFKNSDTASLIQKLQSKYGSQIPDNLKDKIPSGLGGDPSALLKNPEIQDLIKKYKN